MFDNNFNVNTKGLSRMIETLENSPRVRRIIWGFVAVLMVYAIGYLLRAF